MPVPETPRLISADSHVVEPPEVFAAAARRFGSEMPRLVETADRGWVLDTGLGRRFQPGRFATAGFTPRTPEYDAQERSGYARSSSTDVAARLADMDRDGVEAEVLYPSIVGAFLSGRKVGPDVTAALCRSYDDWLAETCRAAPRRLFPLACIPLGDLDAAVAEIERARKLGHVGIVIPAGTADNRPFSDPAYDVLWAAARDTGSPVAFHAGYGSDRTLEAGSLERHDLRYSLRHVTAAIVASDLIDGGVCDRFPETRFVFAEFGIGWIASFLGDNDWRRFRIGDRERSKKRFSDEWRRHFRATFEDDAIGVRTRSEIGVEALMWASDFPHGDSVWPNSRTTVDDVLADCTPRERHAITAANVVELYQLPMDVAA
jgi:predicted TIM-barrel fold metal-dependent hydrolase